MASEREKQFHIWDTYWNFDRIGSFDIQMGSPQQAALERHWIGLLGRLPGGARILDIGCGNGAASLAFARAARAVGRPLEIVAIDDAAIDPHHYCQSQAPLLAGISFKPRVKMEALPFEDGSFDAIASQYAIEYSNLAQSFTEARRVLKPGGLISILALPAQSSFVQRAGTAVKQARHLLNNSALFEHAAKVVREYHEGGDGKDEITRTNLLLFSQEVERFTLRFDANAFEVVSATVTRLNDIFIERTKQTLDAQLNEIASFRTRLAHYAARCQATVKAAVGDRRYETFKNTLTELAFTIADTRSVFLGGQGVLATHISAIRGFDPPPPAAT